MTFNSLCFFIFFAITICLFFLLPGRLQNPLLLLSSYVFYAAFDIWLSLYLIIATFIIYVIAIYMDILKDRVVGGTSRAKIWMGLGVSLCLLPLLLYKYTNFISSLLAKIIGYEEKKQLNILVPLGISFITFSLVSYLVDVYRGKINVERNILKFALFVSFFPKVVQGPIEKAGDILPQFDEVHHFNIQRFREGMIMTLYGLFMKMVVADTAGIVVDTIFKSLSDYSGATILIAILLFMIQIYCDFAGYSLIAAGTACILGFEFKRNFRQPYMSLSVTEFWKRWHISLNRWLTDYLYIPLGGSHCSKARHKINILVTFLLSGLWHGAAGGYIVWGFLNGVYVIVEATFKELFYATNNNKLLKDDLDAVPIQGRIITQLFRRIIVFVSVMFSWIFFRAQKCHIAIMAIKRIFTDFNIKGCLVYVKERMMSGAGTTLYGIDVVYGVSVLLIGILIICIVDIISVKRDLVVVLSNGNRAIRWTICYVLIFAIILFGVYGYGYNSSDFIYAAF